MTNSNSKNTTIETITKLNQESQNQRLRLFAKVDISTKLKILEKQKELFHKLKGAYSDIDNSVLTLSLSKNWNKVDYNKKGITTLKEENIVTGVKSSEFTANYLVNYEKSIYPKDYIAFAQKRGNTVKKYNSTINKKAMNRIDPSFSATHFYQDTQNNYHNVATAPFYIEYDKDGRVVSALGSYVYKSGKYDITADCYHTYFSGAKAKIIETIFTKKELEDNLAF